MVPQLGGKSVIFLVVEVIKQGDYKDILSLNKIITHCPISKVEVDIVTNKCAFSSDKGRRLFLPCKVQFYEDQNTLSLVNQFINNKWMLLAYQISFDEANLWKGEMEMS